MIKVAVAVAVIVILVILVRVAVPVAVLSYPSLTKQDNQFKPSGYNNLPHQTQK
jgi:hypothetical protein